MASSDIVMATLEPIPSINDDDDSRHHATLVIKKNDAPVILGRNTTTGIKFSGLSQTAATVEYKNDQLWFERYSSHCSVLVKKSASVSTSDSMALGHGDVVRLYKQEYAYRVKLVDNGNSTQDQDSNELLWKQTEEECMCAVCMEIIVEATAIVPCGHTFCKACLQDCTITECPNCRLNIQTKLPIKTVDNLIDKLVRSKQVFQQADVQHYLQRVKPLPPPPDSPGIVVVPRPSKQARRNKNTPVVSVDLTAPQQVGGNTAEDAICID